LVLVFTRWKKSSSAELNSSSMAGTSSLQYPSRLARRSSECSPRQTAGHASERLLHERSAAAIIMSASVALHCLVHIRPAVSAAASSAAAAAAAAVCVFTDDCVAHVFECRVKISCPGGGSRSAALLLLLALLRRVFGITMFGMPSIVDVWLLYSRVFILPYSL